jgi:HEAT repeat protein
VPLLKDRSVPVRSNAAYALGDVGDASHLPALEDALKDPDAGVRDSAARAIEKIKARQAATK